jgi:mRNA interferase MazF
MNSGPGEGWLADVGMAAKTGPAVIVSRQDPDPPRAFVLYDPLTTKAEAAAMRSRCPLGLSAQESFANVWGLGSLPLARLERKIGILPSSVMTMLKIDLSYALDLSASA